MSRDCRTIINTTESVQNAMQDAAQRHGLRTSDYLVRCHRLQEAITKHGGDLLVRKPDGTEVLLEVV